jgi:hypothetical protein
MTPLGWLAGRRTEARLAHNLAVKVAVTPLLIGGASLAGRRWGHHVGGWLVALPLTSGPVAFFLATDYGTGFAAHAAVGMLAATTSQVAFALAYRVVARRGWLAPCAAGCAAFAATTAGLATCSGRPYQRSRSSSPHSPLVMR